jgi:hypothetical protein
MKGRCFRREILSKTARKAWCVEVGDQKYHIDSFVGVFRTNVQVALCDGSCTSTLIDLPEIPDEVWKKAEPLIMANS